MDEKIVKDSQGLVKDLVNDCISRRAAIHAICRDGVRLERGGALMITISTAKQWAVDLLDDLPSVQPDRKRGKWEPWRCDMYKCSECDYIYTELTDLHRCGANYCPNCGAEMREVDDERLIYTRNNSRDV